MSYYKILGFDKEPFSTSPDPNFLYMSAEHESALTNTLIELNLKRGLNIILGDIGTGKTTLSRKLIQQMAKRERFLFQIILNPFFEDEKQFMIFLMQNFNIQVDFQSLSLQELRDIFEKFLLERTLEQGNTVIVIIDEAQKLSIQSLETLRMLLNYETNEFKLIQIVLLGQVELYPKILEIPNFYDRINFKFTLYPFNLEDTKNMIAFRLKEAGYNGKMNIFLDEAIKEIYNYTNGYPRRITILCHKSLKKLILDKKYVVDVALVREIIQEEERMGWQKREKILQQNNNYLN
ncbi:MAG: AAA family ATPase [Candidatus Omnitrophica bacterium]|nr:AAA family ATPase [Candidatus Omnitrophota bacterium]